MKKSVLKSGYTKYFVVALAFAIWMLFFDKHNVFRQAAVSSEVAKLEQKKLDIEYQIDSIRTFNDEVDRNLQATEKYAREQYTVKREDEDVYVIIKNKYKR